MFASARVVSKTACCGDRQHGKIGWWPPTHLLGRVLELFSRTIHRGLQLLHHPQRAAQLASQGRPPPSSYQAPHLAALQQQPGMLQAMPALPRGCCRCPPGVQGGSEAAPAAALVDGSRNPPAQSEEAAA